jgi:CTP:molybdopterin cytidylyltransferase MocA
VTPAGLVLAAGAGRRMGSPKALLSLHGELLVDRAADTLRAAGCDPVVVVLGAAAREVIAAARLDSAVVVVNDGWEAGMGSSLRCGLNALAGLAAPAVVVSLVDQPRVSPDVVRRLVESWPDPAAVDGIAAVVATYGGAPRNPVLLAATVWSEVAVAATGDKGARAWLRAHPDAVLEVACDDLGSALDIDTPDDLMQFLEDSP